MEVIATMEAVKCPVCSQGNLVPLFTSDSTNWVCNRPDCSYIIHQHGSANTKVWKGQASRDKADARGEWLETP
jgi:ssDNA-binding Zn-finger/Zn-ribbon topoisomerase 1